MADSKIKVHVHDDTLPAHQECLAQHELEPGKIITLHMHDGECTLCPEGHCHYGSIGIVIGLNGDLMVSFESAWPPTRITFDDFKPKGKVLHQGGDNDV